MKVGRLTPRRATCVLLVALSAVLVGCRTGPRAVPFVPPNPRPLAPADASVTASGFAPGGPALVDSPARPPRNILALSSGGVYGAFSAGVLAGWTASGTRPEFDVVTGVSTGALIAPFAFLGPEYDCQAGRLYVGVKADDIYRLRAWVTVPWKDAVATSGPLLKLIESQITPDLMTKLAAEHRRGRRLYVGTTNLDTRRFVVWDVGAIACGPCPEACRLVRDVLLASASVPGVMPPVGIDVVVDGKTYRELHCDGGATAPVFVPSGVFAEAARTAAGDGGPPGTLHVVVAGKLYADAGPVRRRVLPVLGATANTILYSNCRSEVANLYALARGAGLDFRLAALRQDFRTVDDSLAFDNKEQRRLHDEGVRVGGSVRWPAPPELMPGDGDYVRTGVQLRTAPPELLPISP